MRILIKITLVAFLFFLMILTENLGAKSLSGFLGWISVFIIAGIILSKKKRGLF